MIDTNALEHFKKVDPVLYTAATQIKKPAVLRKSPHVFVELCDAIINQQLSTKVGDILSKRFRVLCDDDVTPQKVMNMTPEQIRAIGTSNAKARYIIDLAQKVVSHEVNLERLEKMTDQEVIDELIKVKGIGPWTAEMVLMFTLGREDIFSFGDLGLKRGIQKLYNLKKKPTITYMQRLSKKWSPYRTYAAMVLWRSLE